MSTCPQCGGPQHALSECPGVGRYVTPAASPAPPPTVDVAAIRATFCPEDGAAVEVDEDGCCTSSGATATGAAVDQVFVAVKERDAALAALKEVAEALIDSHYVDNYCYWIDVLRALALIDAALKGR